MPTVLVLPLVVLLARQDDPAPRIVTEDLEGRAGIVEPSELPLADPRTRGAWILRPEGFGAAAEPPGDGGVEVRVALVNGDELTGRVHGAEGEELRLELAGGVVLPLALESVRSLVVPAHVPADLRETLSPAAEGDRLYRVAGAMEPVDGTLEAFADEGVRFDSVLGARTIPWSEVGALFLEELTGGTPPPGAGGVPVVLSFAGPAGGRVRGELVSIEREHCRVVLGGAELEVPLAAVYEVLVADGRVAYLSDLAPAGETGRGAPFGDELGMTWPHRVDRSVLGGELRAGGRVFRRGIGMHAPSRLAFALEPGWRTLRGAVAIDDSTAVHPPAARGSVVFRILADGKALWTSPLVRGGDPPLPIPSLALDGARELVLELDPAGDFAGDRADWLGLVLVR